jgi:CheY-like chemotaxis protein
MEQPTRHILIVDNDARIVEEIVRGLSDQTTFQIHAFTNGADARTALQQTTFDLIITDWKMADVDGLTLIREAKAQSPETVTVLMSAYEMAEVESLPEDFTAHHYLTKPFMMDELISVVNAILPPAPALDVDRNTPLVLKVILGGDANVGKTSLIERYCTCIFDPQRDAAAPGRLGFGWAGTLFVRTARVLSRDTSRRLDLRREQPRVVLQSDALVARGARFCAEHSHPLTRQ